MTATMTPSYIQQLQGSSKHTLNPTHNFFNLYEVVEEVEVGAGSQGEEAKEVWSWHGVYIEERKHACLSRIK